MRLICRGVLSAGRRALLAKPDSHLRSLLISTLAEPGKCRPRLHAMYRNGNSQAAKHSHSVPLPTGTHGQHFATVHGLISCLSCPTFFPSRCQGRSAASRCQHPCHRPGRRGPWQSACLGFGRWCLHSAPAISAPSPLCKLLKPP